MGSTLADRLNQQRRRSFVGRQRELELYRSALQAEELPFLLLYGFGPGGVGKTTLLRQFAGIAQELGTALYMVDCRFVPPSPDAVEQALMISTGTADPVEARAKLGEGRTVLMFDTFELFHPLDGWFRETFLPALPDTVLTVVMGRNPPSNAFKSDSAWSSLSRIIGLRNLTDDESRKYLVSNSVPADQHEQVLEFTHGHPLALSLVCETMAQNSSVKFEPEANPDIINLLLERFLDNVPGPAHRQTLEAAALLRNTTEALIAAMVGEENSFEMFEWLKTLSFMESGPFGMYPHDLAREAVTMELRWRNPDQYTLLHNKARTYYADHLEKASGIMQQMILSDYIYLHRDNPAIKPFFDWNLSASYIDHVKPEDLPAIFKMVETHEGKESAEICRRWLSAQPLGTNVLRDSATNDLRGFLTTIDLTSLAPEDLDWDPGALAASKYLAKQAPLRTGERSLMFRFWMAKEGYQQVSADQSLIFVTIVFQSLTSPGVAHTFVPCADADFFLPMFAYASMPRIPEADFTVAKHRFGVFGHDWRVMPVKAWLALLSEREIPVAGAPAPTVQLENVVVLSQESFEIALNQALRSFSNASRLIENPLIRSRMVVDQLGGGDPDNNAKVTALRAVILEQAQALTASSKDRKLFQALETSYFRPARSQEVAAEQIDVSIATYRRHLKAGVQRLVELLWQIETGG